MAWRKYLMKRKHSSRRNESSVNKRHRPVRFLRVRSRKQKAAFGDTLWKDFRAEQVAVVDSKRGTVL